MVSLAELIHGVPGTSVISKCGYITEKISAFLNIPYIVLSKSVKSYVKGTNCF